MNINKLILFVNLAKSKNLSLTASELYMTQPAVSQNLHSLEKELGMKLMIRKSNGIELTESGEKLAKEALKVVEQYERFMETVKELSDMPQKLRVLYTGKLEKEIIAKAISLDENNKLEIELCYGMYFDAEAKLEKGEVDLVLTIPTTFSKKWNTVSLLKTPTRVITKKGHFNQSLITLEELKKNKISILDLQSSGIAGKEFRKNLLNLGLDESNFIETDSIESQMLLVESGKAVTMMSFVNHEYVNADVCALEGDPVYVETVCAFDHETEAIRSFIHLCKKAVQPE